MGILTKIRTLIKISKIIASNPKSLRLIASENQIQIYKNLVKTRYNLEKGLPKANILDVIPNLDENIKLCYLYAGSLCIDYAILKGLCRRFENCRYLEIGTWRGESILNVSDIANECVSISLSNEEMKKIGLPEEAIKISRLLSKDLPNVKHIEHDSQTYDFSKIGKFDLIFIDGDHSYEGVKKDTENAFKLLRKERQAAPRGTRILILKSTIGSPMKKTR